MIRIYCDSCQAEINEQIVAESNQALAELIQQGKVARSPFGDFPVFCRRCQDGAEEFWVGPWTAAVKEIVAQGHKRLTKLARRHQLKAVAQ